MRSAAVFLASVALSSHARRVQYAHSEDDARMASLATTLLAMNPAAFNVPAKFSKFSGSRPISRATRPEMAPTQDELKKQVAYQAVDDYVKSGMVVGLGTGSTAAFAVERVGEKLKSGELKDIICIPTSVRTKEQCEELNIPLTTLGTPESRNSKLDVAIDGADEIDPALNLVKGGGGALFREKIVEECAEKFIVIADETKLCDGLGPGFALPVEVVPFCHEHTMNAIAALPSLKGCKPQLRLGSSANNQIDGDEPAVTDNGNYIIDLFFDEPMKSPPQAAEDLIKTTGVVEHGLFCGMATVAIIAGSDGISVKTPQ
jgi:ribose 5-phosphate isomerase A